MRFEGTIKTWHDDRGFGFIEPDQGGLEVFVHINAFRGRSGRPEVGDRVSFEIELNAQGKKRARDATMLVARRPVSRRRADPRAQWGTASYFAIPAFVALYFGLSLVWRVPQWLAGLYVVGSLLTFAAYAVDKRSAQRGSWRIRESTLLMLGAAGGWPGAIVAQQLLRHKSVKGLFRAAFWGSVLLNVAVLVVLVSPLGRSWVGR